MSHFHLKSKNLFLTFPQCDFPLEEFKQKVLEFFEPFIIVKGVASREQHEDGNYHLHLYVNLDKQCQTRNVSYFDNLVSPAKHPNIVSRVKSQQKTIEYVIKDGTYLVLPDEDSFDLQLFLSQAQKKKSTKISTIVKTIKKGATLDELDNEFPGYMLQHLEQVQRYLDFQELKKLRLLRAEAQQEAFRVCPAVGHANSLNKDLALWLNQNIRTPTPRPHRTPQLWIRASPAMGKTTMIEYLRQTFNLSIYYLPLNEKWYDGYADGCFDLIILDEYKAHKKITDLNPILSGDPVPLSRRSNAPVLKRDNLPVIILSNFLPHECYHKASPLQLAPLISRLNVLDFGDTPIRIVKEFDIPETPPASPIVLSDPELDEIYLEVPDVIPVSSAPEPSIDIDAELEYEPQTLPPIFVEHPELDPNSDFFFSEAYRQEIRKRMRGDQAPPVQTVKLSRAMRSIQPKKTKRPRNNTFINQFFDAEAQDSEESDELESDDDLPHSSDEDFLDDSDPLEESSPSPPPFQRSRRVRFLLDSQE